MENRWQFLFTILSDALVLFFEISFTVQLKNSCMQCAFAHTVWIPENECNMQYKYNSHFASIISFSTTSVSAQYGPERNYYIYIYMCIFRKNITLNECVLVEWFCLGVFSFRLSYVFGTCAFHANNKTQRHFRIVFLLLSCLPSSPSCLCVRAVLIFGL